MSVYYFANQIYQFSNAMPLYRAIGGLFIIKKYKRQIQFKKYMKGTNTQADVKTLFNTPPVIIKKFKHLDELSGKIISLSNVIIPSDKSRSKTIFIGHGTGDKKYGSNEHNLESYDYHFISGPKHIAKLNDEGLNIPKERLIQIGNLRFDDYVNGKIDREKVLDRKGVVDKSRKNILYAPTWKWGNGTFHQYVYKFSKEITREHNLFVRPHHHDRQYINRVKFWAKLKGIRHVYFSNPANISKSDTMDDFAISDLMISDTSSIIYEYLITKNPIIVINNNYQDLHNMSDDLSILKHVDIYDNSESILQMINDNLMRNNQDMYNQLLHNCFYFNDGKSVDRAVQFLNSI